MRKPTQQEIDDFIKYRSLHVALVQKLGKVCFDMDFTDHDSDKINAIGKELDLFAMRNASKKGNLHLSKEDKNELRKVSARHAKHSKHHAEYWDPAITIRNFKADDTNIIVAKHMPKRYIAEMACDWASCALYHNEPIMGWYNKVIDDTLFLTDNQKQYLLDCLEKIEKEVIKNNIQFPERNYDCEQIQPLKEDEGGCVSAGDFSGMEPEKVTKIVKPLIESSSNNLFMNSDKHITDLDVKFALKSMVGAYIVARRYGYQSFLDEMIQADEGTVTINNYSKMFEDEFKDWAKKVGPALLGDGDVIIYRGFKDIDIDTEKLGNCWTVDEKTAHGFGTQVIKGKTPKRNIDRLMTIILGIINIFSREYEVRLWDDSKVEVLEPVQ